jgi:hypothetical protein
MPECPPNGTRVDSSQDGVLELVPAFTAPGAACHVGSGDRTVFTAGSARKSGRLVLGPERFAAPRGACFHGDARRRHVGSALD